MASKSSFSNTLPTNSPAQFLNGITDGFSDARKLGEGAFGTVYKLGEDTSLRPDWKTCFEIIKGICQGLGKHIRLRSLPTTTRTAPGSCAARRPASDGASASSAASAPHAAAPPRVARERPPGSRGAQGRHCRVPVRRRSRSPCDTNEADDLTSVLISWNSYAS
ncbi:uncharacterized protein LOC8060030 [Sorghum bicolor]|uniref:uncharacterized protein LOC8060030 n=1 Tax=Sorghum bicolor TaxID=4558 RepID=UPI000B4243F3|nr:uncharacterized protein LOC8060030 [Sorghum bicolor]|eukprot:XP_021316850.1 uncharacterized protein LOC8060030 [Sorghum bicolor]